MAGIPLAEEVRSAFLSDVAGMRRRFHVEAALQALGAPGEVAEALGCPPAGGVAPGSTERRWSPALADLSAEYAREPGKAWARLLEALADVENDALRSLALAMR